MTVAITVALGKMVCSCVARWEDDGTHLTGPAPGETTPTATPFSRCANRVESCLHALYVVSCREFSCQRADRGCGLAHGLLLLKSQREASCRLRMRGRF
jgi:hypothetical protein